MIRPMLTSLVLLFLATGCMPSVRSVMVDHHRERVASALTRPLPGPSASGSLWNDGNARIFTDPKAHQVGDLVTVLVQEQASATRNLGTKKSKKSTSKTSVNAFLGYETSLSRKNPNFKPSTAVDISNDRSFDGSGSTNNSDTLTASVTAVVTRVFPNGNMEITGRRELTINQQPQAIVFTGIIRPVDISAENTIPSSKVAQVSISYGSGGELATVAHEGWLTRALDLIWPF